MGIVERKNRERLNRKIDILNAAERIFYKKGFEYSTMDDIAKEAEFTKKTIY
jgi:AcrR family transcriptional regulator